MQEFYKLELLRESSHEGKRIEEYLIGQALGGGEIAEHAAEASAAFGVSVLPFAGVAAHLSHPDDGEMLYIILQNAGI